MDARVWNFVGTNQSNAIHILSIQAKINLILIRWIITSCYKTYLSATNYL